LMQRVLERTNSPGILSPGLRSTAEIRSLLELAGNALHVTSLRVVRSIKHPGVEGCNPRSSIADEQHELVGAHFYAPRLRWLRQTAGVSAIRRSKSTSARWHVGRSSYW
jgi:hypothetical protein